MCYDQIPADLVQSFLFLGGGGLFLTLMDHMTAICQFMNIWFITLSQQRQFQRPRDGLACGWRQDRGEHAGVRAPTGPPSAGHAADQRPAAFQRPTVITLLCCLRNSQSCRSGPPPPPPPPSLTGCEPRSRGSGIAPVVHRATPRSRCPSFINKKKKKKRKNRRQAAG